MSLHKVINNMTVSPATLELYTQSLAWLERYEQAVGPINRQLAHGFARWLKDSSGLAATTQARVIKHVKKLYSDAVSAGYEHDNVFADVKVPCVRADADWQYITRHETDILLANAGCDDLKCLIALCRWAGLRRNEALGLQWSHIDWERRRIIIKNDTGVVTTKKKQREVPISPDLYNILWFKWSLSDKADYILRFSISEAGITKRVSRLLLDCGVTDGRRPLHTLRKCCSTDWMRRFGVHIAAEWLGDSPEVALRHYSRATDGDFNKASGLNINKQDTLRLLAQLNADELTQVCLAAVMNDESVLDHVKTVLLERQNGMSTSSCGG